MRFKSFYSLLDARFKRVSLSTIIADHKSAHTSVMRAYESGEFYEYLALMTPQAMAELEKEYIVFEKRCPENGVVPLLYERKDYYSRNEYEAMCEQTGITIQECEEIIKATA